MYLLFKTGDFPIASHVAGGWVVTGIRFYSGKSPGSCSTTLSRDWSQILDSQSDKFLLKWDLPPNQTDRGVSLILG